MTDATRASGHSAKPTKDVGTLDRSSLHHWLAVALTRQGKFPEAPPHGGGLDMPTAVHGVEQAGEPERRMDLENA
jgi:hypothetical protein